MRTVPALLTALTLAIAHALPMTAQAQDIKAGRHIAEQHCARCHAVGRKGASPFDKATPFRLIHKKYPIQNLEEAFGEGATANHLGMPDFEFSPRAVSDLLAYMQSFTPKRRN